MQNMCSTNCWHGFFFGTSLFVSFALLNQCQGRASHLPWSYLKISCTKHWFKSSVHCSSCGPTPGVPYLAPLHLVFFSNVFSDYGSVINYLLASWVEIVGYLLGFNEIDNSTVVSPSIKFNCCRSFTGVSPTLQLQV